MKRTIVIGIALFTATPCTARKSYQEFRQEAWDTKIERRKKEERDYAARIVRNAKAYKNRKERDCACKAQKAERSLHNLNYQKDRECAQLAYRQEVSHFNHLIANLSSPTYTQQPIVDLVREAEFSLQNIAAYQPKDLRHYQAKLEYAIRNGKHPMNHHDKKLYSNTQLMTHQSMDSLIECTHSAEQLIEQTALHAEEVKNDLMRSVQAQRETIAALTTHLNSALAASQERIQKLTKMTDDLKNQELKIAHKETNTANMAQCVDATFNVVSTNRNRVDATEKIIQSLEDKAHKAEKQAFLLMLRLHAAERSLRAIETKTQPSLMSKSIARS